MSVTDFAVHWRSLSGGIFLIRLYLIFLFFFNVCACLLSWKQNFSWCLWQACRVLSDWFLQIKRLANCILILFNLVILLLVLLLFCFKLFKGECFQRKCLRLIRDTAEFLDLLHAEFFFLENIRRISGNAVGDGGIGDALVNSRFLLSSWSGKKWLLENFSDMVQFRLCRLSW